MNQNTKLKRAETQATKCFSAVEKALAAIDELQGKYDTLKESLATKASSGESADSDGCRELASLREAIEIATGVVPIKQKKHSEAMRAVDSARLDALESELNNIKVEFPLVSAQISRLTSELAASEGQLKKNIADRITTVDALAEQTCYSFENVHYVAVTDVDSAEALINNPLVNVDTVYLRSLVAEWRAGLVTSEHPGKLYIRQAYIFYTNDGKIIDAVVKRYQDAAGKFRKRSGRSGRFEPEAHRAALEQRLFGTAPGYDSRNKKKRRDEIRESKLVETATTNENK